MTVACPATRRDGRRRLRLRKRKWETLNLKVRNFKLETSNCESENLQTWVFKIQTWNLKLRKWKSLKLRAESFQLLSFDKLQVLKLRIRTACSKLSYQSWMLKVVKYWSCWILKVIKVECWKLLNLQSWILKVVESWKLSHTVKVLNIESLQIVRICCLLTSFQRRSYCTQSDIKRIKRSEELWKVIFQKKFYEFASSILADRIF